jgi:hypothetical protein
VAVDKNELVRFAKKISAQDKVARKALRKRRTFEERQEARAEYQSLEHLVSAILTEFNCEDY